tara:strand:+ start:175 stop:606 length:432 start_codon:yes stop_codon:yes gene_type:complete
MEKYMNDYVENVLSRRIYDKMQSKSDQEVAIDPATIILIGKISLSVIRAIKKCAEEADEREEIIKSPTSKNEKVLKRIVRRELGWIKYLLIGGKVIDAMKEMGTEVSHSELDQSQLFTNDFENSNSLDPNFSITYNGERYYEV